MFRSQVQDEQRKLEQSSLRGSTSTSNSVLDIEPLWNREIMSIGKVSDKLLKSEKTKHASVTDSLMKLLIHSISY
jgi:hypothetical protein